MSIRIATFKIPLTFSLSLKELFTKVKTFVTQTPVALLFFVCFVAVASVVGMRWARGQDGSGDYIDKLGINTAEPIYYDPDSILQDAKSRGAEYVAVRNISTDAASIGMGVNWVNQAASYGITPIFINDHSGTALAQWIDAVDSQTDAKFIATVWPNEVNNFHWGIEPSKVAQEFVEFVNAYEGSSQVIITTGTFDTAAGDGVGGMSRTVETYFGQLFDSLAAHLGKSRQEAIDFWADNVDAVSLAFYPERRTYDQIVDGVYQRTGVNFREIPIIVMETAPLHTDTSGKHKAGPKDAFDALVKYLASQPNIFSINFFNGLGLNDDYDYALAYGFPDISLFQGPFTLKLIPGQGLAIIIDESKIADLPPQETRDFEKGGKTYTFYWSIPSLSCVKNSDGSVCINFETAVGSHTLEGNLGHTWQMVCLIIDGESRCTDYVFNAGGPDGDKPFTWNQDQYREYGGFNNCISAKDSEAASTIEISYTSWIQEQHNFPQIEPNQPVTYKIEFTEDGCRAIRKPGEPPLVCPPAAELGMSPDVPTDAITHELCPKSAGIYGSTNDPRRYSLEYSIKEQGLQKFAVTFDNETTSIIEYFAKEAEMDETFEYDPGLYASEVEMRTNTQGEYDGAEDGYAVGELVPSESLPYGVEIWLNGRADFVDESGNILSEAPRPSGDFESCVDRLELAYAYVDTITHRFSPVTQSSPAEKGEDRVNNFNEIYEKLVDNLDKNYALGVCPGTAHKDNEVDECVGEPFYFWVNVGNWEDCTLQPGQTECSPPGLHVDASINYKVSRLEEMMRDILKAYYYKSPHTPKCPKLDWDGKPICQEGVENCDEKIALLQSLPADQRETFCFANFEPYRVCKVPGIERDQSGVTVARLRLLQEVDGEVACTKGTETIMIKRKGWIERDKQTETYNIQGLKTAMDIFSGLQEEGSSVPRFFEPYGPNSDDTCL